MVQAGQPIAEVGDRGESAVVTAGADAHLNVEVLWKKPADQPSE
jgi:hypothetical protein